MNVRGFRFCAVRIPAEERGRALQVLSRFNFVTRAETTSEGVAYEIDMAALPDAQDAAAAELMVKRDVERASALHRTDA